MSYAKNDWIRWTLTGGAKDLTILEVKQNKITKLNTAYMETLGSYTYEIDDGIVKRHMHLGLHT